MSSERIGVHYDAAYERHDTGPGHPESAHRYQVLRAALETLPPEILRLPGRKALVREILLAHDHDYLNLVYHDVESFRDTLRTGDTHICIESYDVALEATGAVLNAVDSVLTGEVIRAFCAVRPPGHHATATRGMGFCIFNHVAVAARYLQSKHGIQRIAIIDWDVHHGNGTQDIFFEDPDVLYISTHEQGIYPYSGCTTERGHGNGEGHTLNIPLIGGTDGSVVLKAWDDQIAPALDTFQPEFLLISCGFDARRDDPVGGLEWTDKTFASLTERAVASALKHCQGRLVSVLEGGYNPEGIASAALAHVRHLVS